jgi:hypothetical protein
LTTVTNTSGSTLAQVAAREGIPYHRLRYVASARGIKYDHRVGVIRVYAPAVVQQLLEAVAGLQTRNYAD